MGNFPPGSQLSIKVADDSRLASATLLQLTLKPNLSFLRLFAILTQSIRHITYYFYFLLFLICLALYESCCSLFERMTQPTPMLIYMHLYLFIYMFAAVS